jgi:hypothetical protein
MSLSPKYSQSNYREYQALNSATSLKSPETWFEIHPIRVTILSALSKTRHHGGFCGSIEPVANSVKFLSNLLLLSYRFESYAVFDTYDLTRQIIPPVSSSPDSDVQPLAPLHQQLAWRWRPLPLRSIRRSTTALSFESRTPATTCEGNTRPAARR